VSAVVAGVSVSSIYVPNGGKDFDAKIRFLEALIAHARRMAARDSPWCSRRPERRASRDRRAPEGAQDTVIGQLPEERHCSTPAGRGSRRRRARARPENDQLFTWWPPWARHAPAQHRVANRLRAASTALAVKAVSCAAYRESDRATTGPVVATLGVRSGSIRTRAPDNDKSVITAHE